MNYYENIVLNYQIELFILGFLHKLNVCLTSRKTTDLLRIQAEEKDIQVN